MNMLAIGYAAWPLFLFIYDKDNKALHQNIDNIHKIYKPYAKQYLS